MALNDLTLSLSVASIDAPFAATVLGLESDQSRVTVRPNPYGFQYINGEVRHPKFPPGVISFTLRERTPFNGFKDTTITIVATSKIVLDQLAPMVPTYIIGSGMATIRNVRPGSALSLATNPNNAWSIVNGALAWSDAAIATAERPVIVELTADGKVGRQTKLPGGVGLLPTVTGPIVTPTPPATPTPSPAGPAINALAAFTTPNTLASGMNQTTPPAFSVATSTTARVVIDPATFIPGQPWQGIGAAFTGATSYSLTNYQSAAQKDATLDDWFNPLKGNWTFMRVDIGDSDFIDHGPSLGYKTYDDAADFSLAAFDASAELNYKIPRIKDALAKNSNTRVIGSWWTPPARYKSSGQLYGANGIFVANTQNFTTFAQYLVKSLQLFRANGVEFWALSQNEPNVSPSDYPGCIWNPVDLNNFHLNYLRPALNAAGFSAVKILGGDAAWADSGTFVSSAINTATFDVIGYHAYPPGGNSGAKNNPNGSIKAVNDGVVAAGKPWMMTEMSSGTTGTVGPVVSDIVDYYAKAIGVNSILNGCSGIIFWNAMLDQQNNPFHGGFSSPLGGAAVSGGLLGVTRVQNNTGAVTYNAEYWLLRHFSFVQIGARAIKATIYGASVMASAFKNGDGSRVVYLYNPTTDQQTVTVTDAAARRGTVVTLAAGDQCTVPYPDVVVAAAAAPSAPAITATPGNAQVAISASASANGSAITGVDIYRRDDAGSYGSTPLTTIAGNADLFFSGSFSYTDTTAANGAKVWYKPVFKSAAGNTDGVEASATPSAGAVNSPAHYMNMTATGSAAYVGTTTNIPRDNVVDLACWTNLQSYTAAASKTLPIAHTWSGGTATGANSGFLFGMDSAGKPTFLYFTVSKAFGSATATAALGSVFTPGTGNGIWLRPIFNLSTSPYTSNLTLPGATSAYVAPSGSCAFFYSTDSTNGSDGTWNQLGTTITGLATTSGLSVQGVPNVGHTGGGDSVGIGKFYKAVLRNTTGVIWAPDFTAQPTGTTAFNDNVASPNNWNVKTANGASIA
jgi:glucosylceramidase